MPISYPIYEYMLTLCWNSIKSNIPITIIYNNDQTLNKPSLSSIISLRRQIFIRFIRYTFSKHKNISTLNHYMNLYLNGENIITIAYQNNFSPYLLCRLLLQDIFGWKKTKLTLALRDPDTINQDTCNNIYIYNNNEIILDLNRLKNEVKKCTEIDTDYSPSVDQIRQIMGEEYEFLLIRLLQNRGIPFESENDLRNKGLAKTPDIKLLIPLGIQDPSTGKEYIVNWIDSKAMFGDKETHDNEHQSQFLSYVNRFGPGMVIYWFDFVETLNKSRDILIVSEFPQNIILPQGQRCEPISSIQSRLFLEYETIDDNINDLDNYNDNLNINKDENNNNIINFDEIENLNHINDEIKKNYENNLFSNIEDII